MKLNKKFITAIKQIEKAEKGKVIFTGSVALVLQKVLDRHPEDIDCFTVHNHYGNISCTMLHVNRESSRKFTDSEGNVIEVVKGSTRNGVPVDYMYRKELPPYVTVKLYGEGLTLKVATVKSILAVKSDYVRRFPKGTEKHKKDLDNVTGSDNIKELPKRTGSEDFLADDLPF